MTVDWTPLRRELAAWRADVMVPELWWRDDDAVAPTPALDRLAGLAREMGMTVHLAIIPESAARPLAAWFEAPGPCVPVVHGWAHRNTAPKDAKKSEFGHPRAEAAAEAEAGLARLRALLGAQVVPLFVPPWNRLSPDLVPALARCGYRAVSTFGPRPTGLALPFVNTHVDPIDWHGSRSLHDTGALIAKAVEALQGQRRSGTPEPFGLLTHHLVHDPAIWTFSAGFLAEMRAGGAIPASLPLKRETAT